ncbi:hypothetical protein S40288_01389 [Stachybotrys chartarum IBT 40288]|nr:hypothetical protein S40288_01389 [Stachybotrys chartarum IBT 40288]
MLPFQPVAVARPRISRSFSQPTTPEPRDLGEAQPPSPPRQRFRLKRRNASHLQAPTQQFLASVASADIPVPSIEEPHVVDEDMADSQSPGISFGSDGEIINLSSRSSHRKVSSRPKTPMPDLIPCVVPSGYPDWSIESSLSSLESSPDYESSRPSTARSTQTSASLFSRFSLTSEELSQCVSPDFEQPERFGSLLSANDANRTIRGPSSQVKPRRAPWTRPMSQHVWFTYLMYLQDPKVTPFRIGKSGIPPHGVCLRVAREAKRSWKGSNPQSVEHRSGSATPTLRAPAAYIQWPHTCASTRAHLRDLCRASAGMTSRGHQNLVHNPTPFGKAASRLRNRRASPGRSPSVFSALDMTKALAVSTSDSMQLQGPIAQLTRSQPEPFTEPFPLLDNPRAAPSIASPDHATSNLQLRSPFAAKSYGPSSSITISTSLRSSPESQRQAQTMSPRRSLRSPVRLTRSRSNTQKRRDKQPWPEPRRPRRPSLGSDMWTDPSTEGGQDVIAVPPLPSLGSTTSSTFDNVAPRTNIQELFESQRPSRPVRGHAHAASLGGRIDIPPRLGSPFSFRSSSFSFPNRLSSPLHTDFDVARRPYATVQQPSEMNAATANTSLASRLAYIDERLKDLRRRDQPRRRSESPL